MIIPSLIECRAEGQQNQMTGEQHVMLGLRLRTSLDHFVGLLVKLQILQQCKMLKVGIGG